jgi:geranyl-CoA carboxylase alpha subunit
MRLVTEAAHLTAALATARSEARNAFGSDELILERAVLRPRHVEFQVFGDAQGHVVHLFERDCSVQRRHQKVVEEAPCPVMTPALRARMGAAAVEAARTIGYEGAGTVEFLLDGAGNFYFLEMNTRLQVEHPVSECITGLDLVALQFAVAHGEALPFAQDDLVLSGHAIEVRLYAEDPANGFLPASGKISMWRPAQGEGLRIDHGIFEGAEISPFYDPMIAKIIAHGRTREEARRRLIHGLEDTTVFGLPTNRDFLIDILKHTVFAEGKATTAFLVEDFTAAERARAVPTITQAALAAVLQWRAACGTAAGKAVALNPDLLDWASAGHRQGRFLYEAGEFELTALGGDRYCVHAEGRDVVIDILACADGRVRARLDGVALSCRYHADGARLALALDGRQFEFENQLLQVKGAEDAAQGGQVRAPMHGRILRLHVETGVDVREGAPLAVLEAMKMEHEVTAAVAGRVIAVHVAIGDQVAANTILIEIEKG